MNSKSQGRRLSIFVHGIVVIVSVTFSASCLLLNGAQESLNACIIIIISINVTISHNVLSTHCFLLTDPDLAALAKDPALHSVVQSSTRLMPVGIAGSERPLELLRATVHYFRVEMGTRHDIFPDRSEEG